MDTQYLAVCEIAEKLTISSKAVNKLIADGALPAYRFGSDVRVKADDLQQFIENSKIRRNTMNDLINQVIMASSTYDAAIDGVKEILSANTSMSGRELESRSIEMVVKTRPELLKKENEIVEAHRLQRANF